MRDPRRFFLAFIIVALGAALAPARADDTTARYFEGLRQRGLYSLAESACLDRLGQPRLSPAVRVEWTIELSRTLAEHARHSAGPEQQQLWQRADDVLQDLLKKEPSNPRRLQVETQTAFVLTSRAEFLAAQAETSPDDAPATDAARPAAAAAVQRLRAVEKSIAAAVAKLRAGAAAENGELSATEVRSLLETVRFTLAGTLLDQARLYPRASPDRANALIDAEEILRRQAGGVPGEPLTWNSRVLLAECARLRGDSKQLATIFASLEKETPPAAVLDRIVAVRARAALDARQPDEAASLLNQHHRRTKTLNGELHYLKALAVAELADVAERKKDPGLAGELRTQLESQVALAENEAGGWWGYRCRQVLAASQENRDYGPELAALVRRARAAWSAGRLVQAIDEYKQAAAKADQAGNEAAAVEVGFSGASVLLQAGRIEEAAADFRTLSERFPKNAKAADAHLMGAYCLGRLYQAEHTQERRAAYTAALESHRELYPDSATLHEAVWMLAALQERRLQATQALRLYESIPADHRRGPEARVAIARCLEAILARVRELKQPAGEWERTGMERLDQTRQSFPEEPAPLSRDQAEAAFRFARLALGLERPDYVRADALLARVLVSPAPEVTADNGDEGVGGAPNAASTHSDTGSDALGARKASTPATPERAGGSQSLDASQPTGTSHPADPTQPATSEDVARKLADAESVRGIRRTATQLRIVSLAGQRRWSQAGELADQLSDAAPAEVLGVLVGLCQLGAGLDEATRHGLGDLELRTAERIAPRRASLTPEQRRQLDVCVAQALVASGQPRKAAAAYEALVKQTPKNVSLRRTYADLLITCGTPECLAKARTEWKIVESSAKSGEPDWLDARYHVAWCAFTLGDKEGARQLIAAASVLYPDLGGPELRAKFRELEKKLR